MRPLKKSKTRQTILQNGSPATSPKLYLQSVWPSPPSSHLRRLRSSLISGSFFVSEGFFRGEFSEVRVSRSHGSFRIFFWSSCGHEAAYIPSFLFCCALWQHCANGQTCFPAGLFVASFQAMSFSHACVGRTCSAYAHGH